MEIQGQQKRLCCISPSLPCRQQGNHQGKKRLLQQSYIAEAADDPRRRWSVIRDVLHVTETKTYRSADESQKLYDTFVVFFNDQIQKAKEAIKTRLSSHRTQPLQLDTAFTGLPLDGLQPPTLDEVRRLISIMPNKSSPVDCMMTSVIKSCADVFAALITQLAKLSFSEGKFPSVTKQCSSPHS